MRLYLPTLTVLMTFTSPQSNAQTRGRTSEVFYLNSKRAPRPIRLENTNGQNGYCSRGTAIKSLIQNPNILHFKCFGDGSSDKTSEEILWRSPKAKKFFTIGVCLYDAKYSRDDFGDRIKTYESEKSSWWFPKISSRDDFLGTSFYENFSDVGDDVSDSELGQIKDFLTANHKKLESSLQGRSCMTSSPVPEPGKLKGVYVGGILSDPCYLLPQNTRHDIFSELQKATRGCTYEIKQSNQVEFTLLSCAIDDGTKRLIVLTDLKNDCFIVKDRIEKAILQGREESKNQSPVGTQDPT